MHAVYVEVEMQEPPASAQLDQIREDLENTAVPAARRAGAIAAYWFGGTSTSGRAVMIFEDEASADKMVEQMPKVGEPASTATTFRIIEVNEVLTSL